MAKIGNPKDLKGNALLTGIKASSGSTLIGSNFTTIKNGSNVTLTSAATGVLVINANDSGKVSKPSTNGTAGQVLKTSGNGGTYWGDAGLASVGWSEISDIPAVVSALPSTSGTSGQVLKAGANGTITWVNAVNSAEYATSTGKVAAGNVYGIVSSATYATSTGKVAAGNVYGIVSSATYATSTGKVAAGNVYGVVSSATYATKAGKVDALDEHLSATLSHVPSIANVDNGKVLKKTSNGIEWATDLTADGSAILPDYDSNDNGKFLQVVSNGTATEWVTAAAGDMTKSDYVSGTGVVKSATYATSTGKVAAGGVYGVVSSATYATSTGKVDAGNVYGVVSSATYATSAGKVAAGNVYGVVSSATYATSAGGVSATKVYGVVSSATYATSAGGVSATNVYGIVSSATYATSTGKVAAGGVYGIVSSATYATSTGKVAAGNVYGVVSSATYATSTGKVAAGNVYGVVSSATYATKAGKVDDLDTHISDTAVHVPSTAGKDAGSVLKIENGSAVWGVDLTADGSAVLPGYGSTDNGKFLQVISNGTATGWVTAATGNMHTSEYVNGTGVVKSASYAGYATSAGKVAAGGVYGVVSSATYATSTGKVAAGNVYGVVSSATYATSAGGVAAGNVYGIVSSATYAGTAGTITGIGDYVKKSTTINGKNLSNNITLTGSDIKIDGTNGASTISAKLSALETSVGNKGAGDMITSIYVSASGNGVVRSATYATSTGKVAAGGVYGVVSSATYATSAGGVSATNVYGIVSSATYATSTGKVAAGNVYGIVSSATYATSTGKVAAGNVYGVVSSATYATKAGKVDALDTHISDTAVHVPSTEGLDNGKVLKIVNGVPEWGVDLTADGSAVLPGYSSTDDGKFLQVVSNGTATEWVTAATGNMHTSVYVNGNGVVKSASYAGYATSAGKVAAGNVYGVVSSATYATSTGGVSAVNVYGVVSSATYAGTAGTMTGIDSYVKKSTTINGKNLSNNVSLTGADIKIDTATGASTISAKISALETSVGNKGNGDMVTSIYVSASGTGVVKSATYATSTGKVAAGNVYGIVSSATYATTAGGVNNNTVTIYAGSADTTNKAGSFTLNQATDSNITVPLATTGKFGVIKVGTGLAITNGVLSATAQSVTVSNAVASNGTTAVAGSAIYSFVESKLDNKVEYEDLAKVAFTGNYNDLSNKPTIGGGNSGVAGFKVSGSTVVSMAGGANVVLGVNNSTVIISATGGGGNVTVDGTITQNGANPVAGSAIWSAISYLANQIANL